MYFLNNKYKSMYSKYYEINHYQTRQNRSLNRQSFFVRQMLLCLTCWRVYSFSWKYKKIYWLDFSACTIRIKIRKRIIRGVKWGYNSFWSYLGQLATIQAYTNFGIFDQFLTNLKKFMPIWTIFLTLWSNVGFPRRSIW